jgi:hypothetical protein
LQNLPNFYLYVDEFQSFANESFADILSEARKYKLNLTIAHQYIEQMSDEVRAAVFGNVGTMITFRVGAYDAEVLEKEFAPVFTAEDLVNLGSFQIYLKLMIDGVASSPFSGTTQPPIKKPEISFRDDIIEESRRTFARPRAEVDAAVRAWHEEGQKKEGDRPAPRSGERGERPPFAGKDRPPHFDKERREAVKGEKKEKVRMFEEIMAQEREKDVRPLSLESLRKGGRTERPPEPPKNQHAESLKKALEALVKRVPDPPQEKPQTTSKPPQEGSRGPENEVLHEPRQEKQKGPHEIPQDELEKLLKVDEVE